MIFFYAKLCRFSLQAIAGNGEFDWGGGLLKSNEDAQQFFQTNLNSL